MGVQSEYFTLETQTDSFLASGNASGTPILARPFFNINPRVPVTEAFDPPTREDAQLASYPSVMRGSISVDATSQLQSLGLALRTLLACESFCNEQRSAYSRVDMITGYRYLRLKDHLLISEENLSSLDRFSLASFEVYDQFDTRNQLHAVDVGAVWQGGWQRFSLDLTLKTAIGYALQEVDIQGSTHHLAAKCRDRDICGRRVGAAIQYGDPFPQPRRRCARTRSRSGVPDTAESCSHAGLHIHLLGPGRASGRPD